MARAAQALAEIGVIGGSGLYAMDGLDRVREVRVKTPFGDPSDALVVGMLDGVGIAFLARHGRGHRLSPSEINYRANIYALRSLGVTRVVSVSAVGSMSERVKPGDIVLPDQFIDLTKRRDSSFFTGGVVAHVAFGQPICRTVQRALSDAAHAVGASVHERGSYVCIEGPQFSTKAESLLYRQWGVDVIGMTNMPEAKLAREAELCYATMALVTDYDCWHESEEAVTVDMILAILHKNVEAAKRVIRGAIAVAREPRDCGCGSALKQAVVTAPEAIPPRTRAKLELLIGRYLPKKGGR
ncbi:S-methyl-5'-thioadenosine phosphorylase [Candidatus Nitrospira bockiana]